MNNQDPRQEIVKNMFVFNDISIRVVGAFEKPMYIVTDLCRALEIENPLATVEVCVGTDDMAKCEVIDSMGRPQETNIISEAGMYALIIRSNAPKAVEFRKWVCAEVLPTIHKTGRFVSDCADKEREAVLLHALSRSKGQTAQLTILKALGYEITSASAAKIRALAEGAASVDLPAELAEELTGLLIDAARTWMAEFKGACKLYRHPALPDAAPGFVMLRNMQRFILRVGGGLLLPHLQASDLASPALRELTVHQLTVALREVKRLLSHDPDMKIHICRVNGRNARVLNIPLDDPRMIEALGPTAC
ncbi:MAG: BRO-N domain-containing protein [Limisphaerales bacterium]